MGTSSDSQQSTSNSTTDRRLAVDGGSFGNTGSIGGNISVTTAAPQLVDAAYKALDTFNSLVSASANAQLSNATNLGSNMVASSANLGDSLASKSADLSKLFVTDATDTGKSILGITKDTLNTATNYGTNIVTQGKNFADDLLASAESARKDSFQAGNDAVQSAFNAVGNLNAQATGKTFDTSQIIAAVIGVAGLWMITKH